MRYLALKTLPTALVFSLLFFASCKKDNCVQTVTYKTFVPVYMSYEELRASVKSEDAQPLKNPGKIYLKGNYIFVNEVDKGIHVIDNSNPYSPQNIGFIKIPGNIDIAAVGDVLYADSYIDLLALDISNPRNVSVIKRVQDALPYRVYTNGGYADPTKGVAIDWEEKEITEKVNTDCGGGNGGWYRGPWAMEDAFNSSGVMVPNTSGLGSTTFNPNTPGIGGSSARFTIAHNTLYVIDQSILHVYDIANTSNPVKVTDKNIGWNIQTIFPYKNHLFIGSMTGVFIYNNSNPLNPTYVSQYNHVTACDPVCVDDDYAYFTLSSDAPCQVGVDQLEVVDISNLATPTLKVTMQMTNPKGIGIDAKRLFICDSGDGLKVYDANNVENIQNQKIAHFSNINAADVIPFNNKLLMIGSDGLYQYDYTNVQNITLMSRIPVSR